MRVRITRRQGTVHDVPLGEEPVIELDLAPGEAVTSVLVRPLPRTSRAQSNVDWRWSLFVVEPVPEGASA